ncbi:unnamed protein product [Alopecurus aequalis]
MTTTAVSKVLDDNNLLIKILLRLRFPTTLVCAALVCKGWYHHASDHGFLRTFGKRHPPRLLGFYMDVWSSQLVPTPCFIPMLPQPLELAAVIRRLDRYTFSPDESIMDCRNGKVFTKGFKGREWRNIVHHPLSPEGGMPIVPPLPTAQYPMQKILGAVLSKEKGDGLSYLYVLAERIGGARNFKINVYVLQDGSWCLHTMATDQIPEPFTAPKVVLLIDKVYIGATFSDDIVVFDFKASSLSKIPLPKEMKYHSFSTTLSRAHDASGVYLTHVYVKLQLCIWFHNGDNWLLIHTICLHEMCTNLRMLDHTLEDERTGYPYLCHVGDNAEFVFLKLCGCRVYLDARSRTMHKVHETAEKDQHFSDIYPFMMTWPPRFPVLKDDPSRMVFEMPYQQQEAFEQTESCVSLVAVITIFCIKSKLIKYEAM